ncbi:collagen-like protein [Pseudolysinimonas yzui]|uniref:Collagen-like protein n=1 Tax=Pseudolysinimonas yzui TaxID=2708254 RepID=A0A8J3GTN4_9MICO|nr:collagen-like protein [Pseudolysinimonas yzui]GHF27247.1 hypothetical protein GCM10011600_30130 [Pseudolysinimonas yzui]
MLSLRSAVVAGILVILAALGGSAVVSWAVVSNATSTSASGADGADGSDGADGESGEAGPVGGDGPAGSPGVRGSAGPQGPAGATGPAGADGADGIGTALSIYEVTAGTQDITTNDLIEVPVVSIIHTSSDVSPVGAGSTVQVEQAGLYRIQYFLRAENNIGGAFSAYLDAGETEAESGGAFNMAPSGSTYFYEWTVSESTLVDLDAFEQISLTVTTIGYETELQLLWMRVERLA